MYNWTASYLLIKKYLFNNLISFDQTLNTILGGDPDMTLSGRMGRDIKTGKCKLCKVICWLLNKIDKNHCANVERHESDEGKDQIFPL